MLEKQSVSTNSGGGLNSAKTPLLESHAIVEALMNAPHDYVAVLSREGKILAVREMSLTPSELEISNFIKFGKSTKEIAETLSLSERTEEGHRRKIRTKPGLNKRSADLRSYLVAREP